LYGADNRWTIWRAKVPITHLKFSGEQINYALGVAPPAINQDVRIIRTNCLDKRALAVGWAALYVKSVVKPVFFVHGWSANNETFAKMASNLFSYGIDTDYGRPSSSVDGVGYTQARNGFTSLDEGAREIAKEIARFKKTRGLFPFSQINVVAHSRGGLIARMAIDRGYIPKGTVQNLVTLATPHHGVSPGVVEVLRYIIEAKSNGLFSEGSVPDSLVERIWTSACKRDGVELDACLTSAEYLEGVRHFCKNTMLSGWHEKDTQAT
jgi:pimeloyl-ACP methyl ester carboxylesterase